MTIFHSDLQVRMAKAGFKKVFIGIETPNEDSLTECNKYLNKNRNMIACVKKIQNIGLEVQRGFIVGFDNDPLSIFERQISFIQKSGIVTAMVGLLNAPHRTRLYNRFKKEDRLLLETYFLDIAKTSPLLQLSDIICHLWL